MNRRGHLSHKVPNVKLRPAPAASSSTAKKRKQRDADSPEMWRRQYDEDGEGDHDEPIDSGNARPWEGIVITFTGVEEKPSLTKLVEKLGGTVESALTVTVTHVVATDVGSAKYNYAIEGRIPVMTPEWIKESHEIWLRGDQIDLPWMQQEYRMQPFQGLKIAISGIEDLARRKAIKHYVDTNGGEYSKDLDRTCTHLVTPTSTSTPKQSEKVKWALREIASSEAARRRGGKRNEHTMKLVYEEWLWDCLGYRGRFKEDDYDARKPRPKARIQAEDVLNGIIFADEKPAEVKNREETPTALKKRRKEGINSLVGELMTTATRETRVKTEPAEDAQLDVDSRRDAAGAPDDSHAGREEESLVDEARRPMRGPVIERKPSLLHRPRTAAFDAPALPAAAKTTPSLPPTGNVLPASGCPSAPEHPERTATPPTQPRTADHGDTGDATSGPQGAVVEGSRPAAVDLPRPDGKFFEGLRFCHVIDEECAGLEKALQLHGGVLLTDEDRLNGAEVDYVVVRLSSQRRPEIVEGTRRPEVVTECWVEACCFEGRMISPDDHIVFRPLSGPMPVPGAEELNVHISGFASHETVYLRRLLKAIGAPLSQKMNRQTTHLISENTDTAKAKKSPEWGIKLVKQSWLLAIGRSGKLEPESEHAFEGFSAANVAEPSSRKVGTSRLDAANMSVVLPLGDPTFERNPAASGSTSSLAGRAIPPAITGTSQRSLPITPSRQLKGTPTHIDDGIEVKREIESEKEHDPANILSPPKRETERVLNQAGPRTASEPTAKPSEGLKVGRTTSAPPGSESYKRAEAASPLNPLRGASTGTSKALGKGDMTDALRMFVEQGGETSSAKKNNRRPRSSHNKVKSNASRTSFTPSTSASPMKAMSPGLFDSERAHGTSPLPEEIIQEEEGPLVESVKVQYIDRDGEKSKRQLLDVLRKSEKAARASPTKGQAQAGVGAVRASPRSSKRKT